MNKKAWWIVGIVVVVILVIAIISKGGSKETGPIKIGFIGPLSGDAATIGQSAQKATELAVENINKSGGINGRQIEMVYEDGKCAGSNASGAASKLINMDKVAAILGGACSGETMAFTKMAEQANMPTLSYCSSNPAITTAGDYIFRDYPSDTYQGVLAADYLYNNLAVKKVVVVYSKIDWAYGIKDVFSANFVKLGGQILSEEGFDPETKDFKTILLKAKSQTPEAIYYLAMTDQTITGLRQAKDLGLKTIFFGGDAWQDSKIWTTVGSAGEGAMYLVPSNMAGDAFKLAMAAKVGNDELGPCSPSAYDGVYILAQVMAKVGIDPAAIKNELYKTVYTGGVSAEKIQFDQNGDLVGAKYAVKKVQNGVAAEVK